MPACVSAVTCAGVTDFWGDSGEKRRQLLASRDQRRLIGIGHRPDQLGVVRPFSGDGEMRPFEMQPCEAGHLAPSRLDAGGDHRRCDFRRVCDQRRQQGGGAERRVRPANRLDAFDIWVVVQHDAAAAIDLQVDEAGREHVAGLDSFRIQRNLSA